MRNYEIICSSIKKPEGKGFILSHYTCFLLSPIQSQEEFVKLTVWRKKGGENISGSTSQIFNKM